MREQNDELNGQILSLSLYEAKTLFATQTKAQSIAAEIDNASRDQVNAHAAVVPVTAQHITAEYSRSAQYRMFESNIKDLTHSAVNKRAIINRI